MLTKLLPDQVSKFWDIIKYAVEQSLPPIVGESPDKMRNILSACLSGEIDVWASYKKEDDKTFFEGIVLTETLYDKPSATKNLLVYCLYGYNEVDKFSWTDGLKLLLKYAKSRGYNQIVGYTDVQSIIKFVEKAGGEAKYTFISFDVNKY